jgi:hypothetical protein
LETVIVYVRLVPGVTGSGVSVFVTLRFALAVPTVVTAVPLSLPVFGSAVAALTAAVFESTVPAATDEPTFTINVKTALPTANEAVLQAITPPLPIAGVVHDQPPGEESETNVVPAGRVSLSATVDATLGPAFATVIV